MTTPKIITGDDVSLSVTLKKNGLTFAISDTATVKIRVISADNKSAYSAIINQSKDTVGADWLNSLVIVIMMSSETEVITHQGKALIEIEVADPEKKTWFAEVNLIKGNI